MNPHNNRNFPATRWSLVSASQRDDEPRARAALSDLCLAYWFPVFAEVRAHSRNVEDAEDRTQDFFQRIIEKRTFADADPSRGKFRTFLLTCLRNFLRDQHERDTAAKRAPERAIAFDAMQAEERLRAEPRDHRSPDDLFTRRYIATLLDACMDELREEWTTDGHAAAFAILEAHILGPELEKETRADLAARLGTSLSHIKAMKEKLKVRFNEILDHRIAETLLHPTASDVKLERTELLRAATL